MGRHRRSNAPGSAGSCREVTGALPETSEVSRSIQELASAVEPLRESVGAAHAGSRSSRGPLWKRMYLAG